MNGKSVMWEGRRKDALVAYLVELLRRLKKDNPHKLLSTLPGNN